MPWSADEGKHVILRSVLARWPSGAQVLDIGPGAGAMRNLLPANYVMDCVEIFEPYVARFNLRERYRTVHVADARTWNLPQRYDVVIMGDVLEHLSVEDAAMLLTRLSYWCSHIIVSVPWNYPQGPAEGNDAETHLQPDLTPEVMASRYPQLAHLFTGGILGVYEQWTANTPRVWPGVTICIPTYARTSLLAEALHSALAIAYAGPVEVLVLNDCPEQQLSCSDPRVRVVNDSTPYATLGDKRNALVDLARQPMIAWLDDDDYLLPNHLDKITHLLGRSEVVLGSIATLYVCNGIGEVTSGACADTIVRRHAIRELGFATMNVGEDWNIVNRLSDRFGRVDDPTHSPTYVQRWCNGAHHITGHGTDPDALIRYRINAADRMKAKIEPVGPVIITPRKPTIDYAALAVPVIAAWKKKIA